MLKISLVAAFVLLYTSVSFAATLPNLNAISKDDLTKLTQISPQLAEQVIDWRDKHAGFRTILDLWRVKGMTEDAFRKIKDATMLGKVKQGRNLFGAIERLHERLLDEDGPGNAAVDVWESYIISPINIHSLSMDELLQFQGVSLVDAANISKAIKERNESGEKFSGITSIRRIENTSNSAYFSLRPFVGLYDSKDKYAVHGDYRSDFDFDTANKLGDTYNNDEWVSMLDYDLTFQTSATDTTSYFDKFIGSNIDTLRLKKRMKEELDILKNYKSQGNHSDRIRAFVGNNIIAGVSLLHEPMVDNKYYNLYKGYALIQNYPYFNKAVVGDFRVALGEGLIIDNTDEYRARSDFRTKGVFGDISNNHSYAFRGGATEIGNDFASILAFGSIHKRSAYKNQDGTYSMMYNQEEIVPSEERDAVKETALGGHLSMNLAEISPLPWGTQIGFTAFRTKYDATFDPQTETFDIPNDKDQLDTKCFSTMLNGDKRTIVGGDFRTVYGIWGLSGEIARQSEGKGLAYIINNYFQYNLGYLKVAKRHYDLAYDNPYNRGFSEHSRFQDTMFEKDYRLNDPLMSMIQDNPSPKPEDGYYAEMSLRLSRQFRITRAYMDFWEDLDSGGNGSRFQGEIEYKPIHPVHFRIKHKHQQRELPKIGNYSESVTDETTFSVFSPVSYRDFLAFQARYGRVKLMGTESTALKEKMDGGFLNTYLNHKFTPALEAKTGITFWTTNGMSQWSFDDKGIDFMDSRGYKAYIVLINRIGQNLDLRGYYFYKRTVFDHNSFYYRPDPQDELVEHDPFTDVRPEHYFGFQLYLHW